MHGVCNASSSDDACSLNDTGSSANAGRLNEAGSSDDEDDLNDSTARLMTASVVRLIADWLDEIDWTLTCKSMTAVIDRTVSTA